MRCVRDLEQEIPLLRFKWSRFRRKDRDLVADAADLSFQFFRRFGATPPSPNFLAESLAVGIELLQRRLSFPALPVDAQNLIQLRLVSPAPGRDAAFYKIRLFPDQADVEHGADCRVRREAPQILILLSAKTDLPWRAHAPVSC